MRTTLYASTIGIAAALLFALELIAGKRLLPFFGGSAAVWAMSLFFFTACLFAGYAYVYLLSRYPLKIQGTAHALLVVFALATSLFTWQLQPFLSTSPAWGIILTLTVWIGAPFFVLATTGPLLQYWFGFSDENPYRLYALSNAGSFVGLCAYPLLLEPFFGGVSLHVGWEVMFALCAIAIAGIAIMIRGHANELVDTTASAGDVRVPLAWVGLAAIPTALLVVVTSFTTQVISPIPLMWMIPLGLYLLSFVVAFSGRGDTAGTSMLLLASAAATYALTPSPWRLAALQIGAFFALVFFASLRCHARLYALRPAQGRLPLFYVYTSLGGMVGTFAVNFLAPLVFNDYWELPIMIAIAALVGLFVLIPHARMHTLDWYTRALGILVIAVALSIFVQEDRISQSRARIFERARNFYGVTTITRDGALSSLVHGSTLHGAQLADGTYDLEPTTYYTRTSGIGRALTYERSRVQSLSVGTIGLGTGSIASYCRPKDSFVFYEIDARVERIARTSFSYLGHCQGVTVRLGDARVSLAAEARSPKPQRYDVLAVDAFSSDSIPLHLLTKEAFALYAGRLASDSSILAVHISNRYLDLAPYVTRLAAESGFASMSVYDSGDAFLGSASTWVLLAKDARVFKASAFTDAQTPYVQPSSMVWTDDYTSLVWALDIPLTVSGWRGK